MNQGNATCESADLFYIQCSTGLLLQQNKQHGMKSEFLLINLFDKTDFVLKPLWSDVSRGQGMTLRYKCLHAMQVKGTTALSNMTYAGI